MFDRLHSLQSYNNILHHLKFVLTHNENREDCIKNIKEFIEFFNIDNRNVYIMTEGQTYDEQYPNMKADLEFCLKEGYNYTPRLHIIVYNDLRGV